MSLSRCPFCTHDNPARSRFCNDCGSPLHLKPCPQCGAVSDDSARTCHQCGFAFAAATPDEPAVASVDAAVAAEATTAAVEPSETACAHVPESFAASLDAHGDRIDDILVASERRVPAVQPDEPSLPTLAPAVDARTSIGPMRVRRTRDATVALLLLVALGVLAYFAYRPSAALNEWLAGVQLDLLGMVRASVPAQPAATTEPAAVAQPSATGASVAEPVGVAADTASTEPPIEVPARSEKAIPPASEASADSTSAAAAESERVGAPRLDAGVSEDEPVHEADVTAEASFSAPTAPAKSRATSSRKAQPRSIAPRPSRPAASAGSFDVPAMPAPSPVPPADARPCTRAVAALGLCDSTGTR